MSILVKGKKTYLFINGISVKRPVPLGLQTTLLPAKCNPHPNELIQATRDEVDLGIAAIFLRRISSQLRISANDVQALAKRAWNAQWDILLLGAIFKCCPDAYLESDKPAESFGSNSKLNVIHYHLHVIPSLRTRSLSDAEMKWIQKYFPRARKMLGNIAFMNAIHSMASYQWNPHPRVRLAILWSGIEGLFGVESELVFRLSLYTARFLSQNNRKQQNTIFSKVKKLYKFRSFAVHGSEIKHDVVSQAVVDSANLLQRLIKRCVETNKLPKVDELAP